MNRDAVAQNTSNLQRFVRWHHILGEWYVLGEYKTEKLKSHSLGGRLGDIRGRPNQADLSEVAEKVKGVLLTVSGK